MPAFVVMPATPDDLHDLVRVQFDACASDPGFHTIFPNGGTTSSIQFYVQQFECDMDQDPACQMMLVRDAMSRELAAFAFWYFYPARPQEDVDGEMLTDKFPLPADANVEAGNRLMHAGLRKRHEVVAAHIGIGQPYAYLAAVGTSPKYQNQGAASLLLEWGIDRVNDLGLKTYVESTPSALRLYLKYGFKEIDRLPLDISPWKEGSFYNFCMIRPSKFRGQ